MEKRGVNEAEELRVEKIEKDLKDKLSFKADLEKQGSVEPEVSVTTEWTDQTAKLKGFINNNLVEERTIKR